MSITTETRRASHEDIKPRKELRRQQIMEAIAEHGPMTVDELMDLLGYADPPYLLQTRNRKQYRIEMETIAQHEELLAALLDHPGPVILSGYESDLYNDALYGWTKIYESAHAENGAPRTETLWLNYEPQETLL